MQSPRILNCGSFAFCCMLAYRAYLFISAICAREKKEKEKKRERETTTKIETWSEREGERQTQRQQQKERGRAAIAATHVVGPFGMHGTSMFMERTTLFTPRCIHSMHMYVSVCLGRFLVIW